MTLIQISICMEFMVDKHSVGFRNLHIFGAELFLVNTHGIGQICTRKTWMLSFLYFVLCTSVSFKLINPHSWGPCDPRSLVSSLCNSSRFLGRFMYVMSGLYNGVFWRPLLQRQEHWDIVPELLSFGIWPVKKAGCFAFDCIQAGVLLCASIFEHVYKEKHHTFLRIDIYVYTGTPGNFFQMLFKRP